MAAEIGFGSLFITLIVSVYGVIAAIYGERNRQKTWILSARQAMRLVFPLLTISIVCLVYLIVTNHFEVVYVSEVSSISMPTYLKITALWGGQSGSLLFWSWLLAAFTSAVTLRKWDRDQEFLPWVIVVSLVTLAFFLILNTFFENPFIRQGFNKYRRIRSHGRRCFRQAVAFGDGDIHAPKKLGDIFRQGAAPAAGNDQAIETDGASDFIEYQYVRQGEFQSQGR
jgi:cytochrome c biogenesis factor